MSQNKSSLQQAADQAVAQHRSMAKDGAAAIISDVFDTLVTQAKVDQAVLPEEVFKSHFLPCFSGEQKITERKEVLTEWIAIAGSPMAEVSVLGPEGQVLFTVPPMFDSSVVDSVRRNLGETFNDIYSQYKMHSNNLPVVGEKFLADALEKKLGSTVKKSEVVADNRQRWDNILRRYGKGPDVSPASTQSTSSVNTGDDVEYD